MTKSEFKLKYGEYRRCYIYFDIKDTNIKLTDGEIDIFEDIYTLHYDNWGQCGYGSMVYLKIDICNRLKRYKLYKLRNKLESLKSTIRKGRNFQLTSY